MKHLPEVGTGYGLVDTEGFRFVIRAAVGLRERRVSDRRCFGKALGETPLHACVDGYDRLDVEVRFFNPDAETRTGLNRLPHWQQEGATYFVTYRLADSIPKELLDRWMEEKADWMTDHPRPWSEDEEVEFHKRFTLYLDTMMDKGHGACVLREKKCRDVLVDSFARFEGDRYVLHSWVAMPNHVHVSFTLAQGVGLDSVVGGWKKFTARIINDSLGTKGALWQKDYFDRIIRDWKHFMRVSRYIRSNPRKAGLRKDEFTLWESDEVKRMLG